MNVGQSWVIAKGTGPQQQQKNLIKIIFLIAEQGPLCRREESCGKGQREGCFPFLSSENKSPFSILLHIKNKLQKIIFMAVFLLLYLLHASPSTQGITYMELK